MRCVPGTSEKDIVELLWAGGYSAEECVKELSEHNFTEASVEDVEEYWGYIDKERYPGKIGRRGIPFNVKKAILEATTNGYRFKDAEKFKHINRFIGRGSVNSSTHAYAKALHHLTVGDYKKGDIIGVSVQGRRPGRLLFDKNEMLKAVNTEGVTFITDDYDNRSRPYNVGERDVMLFLLAHGYRDPAGIGIWKKPK